MDELLDQLLKDSDIVEEHRPTFKEEDELLAPLLSEINLIEESSISQFVRSVLLQAFKFFEAPASFSGLHHPPDERQEGGNLLHTKRVVRIVRMMCEAQGRTQYELDMMTAAGLLHDATKCIEWVEGEIGYDPMHPITIDRLFDYVRELDQKFTNNTNCSTTLYLDPESLDLLTRLIHCHMGPWSPIREVFPLTSLEWMLHYADLIASRLHYIIDGEEVVESRWKINSTSNDSGL